ncbi:hypothetical protein BH11MYX2_BH11MYX2_31220 [soil metagenome]
MRLVRGTTRDSQVWEPFTHSIARRRIENIGEIKLRNVLAYVFNNWRKHREVSASPGWRVDPFSTAALFGGWREGAYLDRERDPADFEHLAVRPAQTWLLRVGWRRHGLLDWREVPSRSGR